MSAWGAGLLKLMTGNEFPLLDFVHARKFVFISAHSWSYNFLGFLLFFPPETFLFTMSHADFDHE
jgi:hypothetical protein